MKVETGNCPPRPGRGEASPLRAGKLAAVLALALMAMAGCRTIPAGYDRDTTPGEDGGGWVGAPRNPEGTKGTK